MNGCSGAETPYFTDLIWIRHASKARNCLFLKHAPAAAGGMHQTAASLPSASRLGERPKLKESTPQMSATDVLRESPGGSGVTEFTTAPLITGTELMTAFNPVDWPRITARERAVSKGMAGEGQGGRETPLLDCRV